MAPLEKVGDLKVKRYALCGRMVVVSMELAIFGDVPLGVRIVYLPWPLDCVAHAFHDGHALNGFDIEGVLRDPGSVPVVCWAVVRLMRLYL